MRTLHALSLLALLPVLAGCGAGTDAAHAATPARLHSPEELRSDLRELRSAVVTRHPRFHDQDPEPALLAAFDAAEAALDRPMTRVEAFRVMARINPHYRDAHTLLMPTFATEEAGRADTPFPIWVRVSADGSVHVDGDWETRDGSLKVRDGTRITAINGEAASDVVNNLSRYSHGETESLRRHMLGVMFESWLAAVRGWSGEFRISLDNAGSLQQIALSGRDSWQRSAATRNADRPTMTDLGSGIALLRLPTFDVDDAPEAYSNAVRNIFSELRRSAVDGLIVDVRGNTGGQSDAGAEVIRYLSDRPVSQASRARERLHEGNRGLFGYKGHAGEMLDIDVSKDGIVKPVAADKRFNGRVVVLIDSMTYSAGILFATTLQDHGLATIVGTPTEGNANQTGNMEPFELPHTKLVAYIPARVFVRPSGDVRDGPVEPDIRVSESDAVEDAAIAAARAFLMSDRPRSVDRQ